VSLTRGQRLLYATGSLGVALSYQAFGTYIQFLYIDVLGLKAALVGLGWSLYGIWNAVNDPLAGHLSDRTRTRWGRRTPWIAGAFIPLGLFFYLLWVPPAPLVHGGQVPLFAWFMGVILVFDLLWTIVVMNWTALFPELVPEPRERAGVSGWRQFFSVLGLVVGVALPPVLVGADWSGRGAMALLLATVTTISFGLALLGIRERPPADSLEPLRIGPALAASWRSVPFRWFLLANLHKELIYSLLTASVPFWAKYVLLIRSPTVLAGVPLDPGLQTSLLLGSAFLMTLPALPVWTAAARRFGARRAWQAAQVVFALAMLAVYLARDFPRGLAAMSFAGLGLAGLLVCPDLLVSDVIDEDEVVTGRRREGMYFGLNGFVIRFAFTLQGLSTGAVLHATGFVGATPAELYPAQRPEALFGIRSLIALLPIAASAVVMFALQRYPLHGERYRRLRSAIESRDGAARGGCIVDAPAHRH
jgi:GPH family glycoside/pentoside/hexuronide:cation symporter